MPMRYTNVKFTWIGDYDTQRWSEDKRHNLLVELCKLDKATAAADSDDSSTMHNSQIIQVH